MVLVPLEKENNNFIFGIPAAAGSMAAPRRNLAGTN